MSVFHSLLMSWCADVAVGHVSLIHTHWSQVPDSVQHAVVTTWSSIYCVEWCVCYVNVYTGYKYTVLSGVCVT